MLRQTMTETGAVRGFPGTDARITVFKGIPFADNTSGDNRWRAPQPAKPWEGVRDCYEFAPITMQAIPGKDQNAFYSREWHVDPEVPMSEDGSLALNIWSPAKKSDEKLPVMIWIFGGGLKEGYCYEMEFDGERIASRGVILVTIAYRVNCFGFMAHPELTAENPDAPTNFGFLDQKAGIDWVKRNIANFGGDPDNITIFGQSAGGGSTLAHLCSPLARGSFNKAIVESAGGVAFDYPSNKGMRHYRTLEKAEQDGVKFLEFLGVKNIAEARKLDAWFVEQKFMEFGAMWRGIIDGKYVTEQVDDTVVGGRVADVPIMIGNTNNEFMTDPAGGSGLPGVSVPEPKDAVEEMQRMQDWAKKTYGDDAEKYLELSAARAEAEGITLRKAATVNLNEIGAQLFAEIQSRNGKAPYYYIFGPSFPGDNAGAFHSSDLWFEFETLMKCWRPFDGHHYDLARKMCNYWTNFAKTGNPNGNDADGTPMPEWKKFDHENPCAIKFMDELTFEEDIYDDKQRFVLERNLKNLIK